MLEIHHSVREPSKYSPNYNHNDNDHNEDDDNNNNNNNNNNAVRCVNAKEILEVKCPYSIRDMTI